MIDNIKFVSVKTVVDRKISSMPESHQQNHVSSADSLTITSFSRRKLQMEMTIVPQLSKCLKFEAVRGD